MFERKSDEALARQVVDRLEAAYWRVGNTLACIRLSPLPSCSLPGNNSARSRGWRVGQWPATTGVFDFGSAARSNESRSSIASCRTSSFMPSSRRWEVGNVPAWMNEGLATVLEPARPRGHQSTLARTSVRPALSTLHQGFVGLATTDAEIAYASSARAVRRLIDQRGVAARSSAFWKICRAVRPSPAHSTAESPSASRISRRSSSERQRGGDI